jgi:trehalose 6-phosphate synthase/phosphatase
MAKLLIVSNRLPITINKRENKIRFNKSVGGLATGLDSFYKLYQGKWIGWPGIAIERIEKQKRSITKNLSTENCYPVFLNQYDIENYYHGFCNRTIWPLFHYFTQHSSYSKYTWESYKHINELFAKQVVKFVEPDDRIWVHDYQLMLLPKLLRKKLPDAAIGFFLHIPFPSSEVFRLLPCRNEIIEGMLGADLIGFHTYDYVHHFIESVRRLVGYEHTPGRITADNRTVKVDAFPMGIDYERFAHAVNSIEVQKEIKKIRKKVGNRKIILSVDRLDYTKGIPARLEAFDYFLERYPKYREKVTLILVAVPSRTGVEQYALLKKRVDELISKINGKCGTLEWMPIWYLYRYLSFQNLVPLYSVADVALITPLRDGMNLIAKEFLAAKIDSKGVLILSEMAGASKELGEAIIVNPNNKDEIADAIKNALELSEKEQITRNETMQKRLKRYNVERWAIDFMESLSHIKKVQQDTISKRLTPETRRDVINDYAKSKRRLFLLDYDGTLTSFIDRPEKAKPDKQLIVILKALAHKKRNEVVIISGRNKEILDQWFGNLNLGLIAEHGVWFKKRNQDWQLIEPLRSEWKAQIRPILELYVVRTPGAFIEEKDFSLVWHYRKADPKLATIRAGELKEALSYLTNNLNLGILEGSKVLEVKGIGINKGHAALKWILKEKWDFIIAIGDDWTDEDTFAILSEQAYSIKVGMGVSRARFSMSYPFEVRELLNDFGKK